MPPKVGFWALTCFSLCLALVLEPIVADWELIWSDEFDQDTLDLSKWYYLLDCSGRGNNELQCYTNRTENVKVENGTLVITARQEPFGGRQYTSGRVHASGKGWTYGRFEARARLPSGKHLWPAIWMVPTDGVYGPWPSSGEIDIMEARGQKSNVIEGTAHFGESRFSRGKVGSGLKAFHYDLSRDYHVYGFEWTPYNMTWFLDYQKFFSTPLNRTFNCHKTNGTFYKKEGQPFDQNFKWILNVAIGGNYFDHRIYGRLDMDEAKYWDKPFMEIDWVRVYQQTNNTSSSEPSKGLFETNEFNNEIPQVEYYYDGNDDVEDSYYYS
jgi:beta-glucanase (GH16 family)